MMKLPKAKTPLQERASLRANEQRRLEHACAVLAELIERHVDMARGGERDIYELNVLKTRLMHAIKNQHIKDAVYKEIKLAEQVLNEGGF